MLDEMSKSSSDGLSVGFRLKTFFQSLHKKYTRTYGES